MAAGPDPAPGDGSTAVKLSLHGVAGIVAVESPHGGSSLGAFLGIEPAQILDQIVDHLHVFAQHLRRRCLLDVVRDGRRRRRRRRCAHHIRRRLQRHGRLVVAVGEVVTSVRRRRVLGGTGLPNCPLQTRRFVDQSDSAMTLMGSDITLSVAKQFQQLGKVG